MDERQKQKSKWTLGRVFSWFAGLSVGGTFLLILLLLLIVAVFVRTDFFQDRLRDQVVSSVENVLEAKISYTEAQVEVFRLFPRISFRQVVLEEDSTKVRVDIERVSVSISLFYSLPLLAFKKIHISSAEISGLSYTLSDTKVFQVWKERLRPADTPGVPSQFQTFIQEIQFSDFNLDLQLAATDIFGEKVDAGLHLNEFNIYFDGDEVELKGNLNVEHLDYAGFKFENIEISLDESLYSQDLFQLEALSIKHLEDAIYIDGLVEDFSNPQLSFKANFDVDLGNYVIPMQPDGRLKARINLNGPLQKLKGDGDLSIENFALMKMQNLEVRSSWSLQYPILKLAQFEAKGRTENLNLSGDIGLAKSANTNVSVKLSNWPVAYGLQLVNPDFAAWAGRASGSAKVRSTDAIWKVIKIQDIGLKVKDFKIQNEESNIPILEVSDVEVNGELGIDGSLGNMNFDVKTPGAQGQVNAEWRPQYYMMNWEKSFDGSSWGELFDMKLKILGRLRGSYGGDYGNMELHATPSFRSFEMNRVLLKNLRGDLYLKDRRLYADALKSEELEVKGGIYFREEGGTEFSDLDFSLSQLELNQILSLAPLEDTPASSIKGKLSGEGQFNDWILEPVGKGNFVVQDLGMADDPTLGRFIKLNWAWSGKRLSFSDIFLETSKDGGGVRGSLTFESGSLHQAKIEGRRVKLGDWAIFFGGGLQLQSLSDFNLEMQRSTQTLNANMELYETIIGSVVQERSKLKLEASGNQLKLDVNLFKDALKFHLEDRDPQTLIGQIAIQNLNVIPLVKQLQGSGLEFMLKGSGRCEIRYSQHARQLAFEKLFSTPSSSSCDLSLEQSEITRAESRLHQVRAFTAWLGSSSQEGFSFRLPKLEIITGRDRLAVSANYSTKKNYRFELSGITGLDSVSYFVPFLSRSEGRLSVEGVFTSSGFTGSLDLDQGLILFQDSPLIIRNVEASLRSQNSVIDLRNLSGDARDGSIQASGRVQLNNSFDVKSALLVVNLNGPLMELQDGLRFRMNGPLSLRIDDADAKVSGQISVYDGSFRRRINLRSDLLKIFQPREEKYEFMEKKESFIDRWKLDVSLATTESFVVRNNIADGAIDFNLYIGGTVVRPRLSGSISLMEGRFTYNNRTFDLKAGSILFTDNQQNIPRYDIRAETEVDEYRVFVTFQGDANQQKIIYSSDPPLTEKEILGLVSYGTPPGEEDELSDRDPTESAALTGISFVTGQLQDTIEGALSGDLGIQRFQIYPAFYSETGKTELQLTVGTDLIRNKLELNYSNFLTAPGGHEMQLGFRINRNISLVGSWRDLQSSEEQNISGDFGGDIIFRFEFD